MKRKRILFLNVDLGGGGAEKVLANLANSLPEDKYDITVRTLFGGGTNEKYLKPHIKYSSYFKRKPFRGFTILQKIFSPSFLYKRIIKGTYDVEIAFLHHTPTRIIGGGRAPKKFAWVHSAGIIYKSYRSLKEFSQTYESFDGVAFVSKRALERFNEDFGLKINGCVVHNVNETDVIEQKAKEPIEISLNHNIINLCSVGRLDAVKGFERLIKILSCLHKEGYKNWHLYLLGEGELKRLLEKQIKDFGLESSITLLGYQQNPYKYVCKMDLFVCSSLQEGYSTAVTESIIVGTPVLTTDCSGMDEILENSGAGIIVENSEDGLYWGLKELLANPGIIDAMKVKAKERASFFSKEAAVKEFEDFIS